MLGQPRGTQRSGWMMNYVYFMKRVFWPGDVHVLESSGFTGGCWHVMGR